MKHLPKIQCYCISKIFSLDIIAFTFYINYQNSIIFLLPSRILILDSPLPSVNRKAIWGLFRNPLKGIENPKFLFVGVSPVALNSRQEHRCPISLVVILVWPVTSWVHPCPHSKPTIQPSLTGRWLVVPCRLPTIKNTIDCRHSSLPAPFYLEGSTHTQVSWLATVSATGIETAGRIHSVRFCRQSEPLTWMVCLLYLHWAPSPFL